MFTIYAFFFYYSLFTIHYSLFTAPARAQTYRMRVQAVCGADLSDWSSWRGFTVPQRSSGDLDKDAYYLFFIDGVKNTDSNGDIGGYMNLKFKKI